MFTFRNTLGFALLATSALAACDTDHDGVTAASEPEVQLLPLCTADFEASITDGPEAGLEIEGKLSLMSEGSRLRGFLEAGDETIAVSGTLADQIVLAFELPDGRSIVGMGPAPAHECSGTIEGFAVGPTLDESFSLDGAETSRGHWIATSLVERTVEYSFELDPDTQVLTASSDGDVIDNKIVPMDCIRKDGGRYTTQCSDGMCTGGILACFIESFYRSCANAQSLCEGTGGMFVDPSTPNQS